MTNLAQEYYRSAQQLHQRIEELKKQNGKEVEESDERIVLLRAEYYHLLRIAHYLEHYYDEDVIKGEIA